MIKTNNASQILYTLYFLRYVEEEIAKEYKKGYMKCPVHLYIGQEAIATGVCLNLLKSDYLVTNHRSHGHYLAKGGRLKELLAELCGLSIGCSKGWGGSQHVYDEEVGILGTSALVGASASIATGIAWALKKKKSKNIAVSFFGDGGTEEGYFYESLNFASLKQLPILFICENNLFATHSRIEQRRHAKIRLYKIAESLGVTALKIDGNDVTEIFLTIKKIVAKIRNGKGPFFVELPSYRWRGHVTPDEDFGERYRMPQEIEKWKKKCPIDRFISLSISQGWLDDVHVLQIKNQVKSRVDKTFSEIRHILKYSKASLVPATPY